MTPFSDAGSTPAASNKYNWEPPTIWLNAEDGAGYEPLFEGQVLCIEMFLSDPNVGSVGVEQNLIVRAGGNELLTPPPLELW